MPAALGRRASFFLSRQFVKHKVTVSWHEQLPEAFLFDSAPRFLVFDRDARHGLEVPAAVHFLKMSPVRTSFESP